MADYTFLRLIDDFDKAKDLGNSKLADFNYDNQIHLKPDESYSIITNVPNQISFNNNILAYLVDCQNNVLVNISNNIIIQEFIHNDTGLKQCKIELIKLNQDFITDLVYLRLDHTILNGSSYWSNPFLLSEYNIEETKRFDFKHSQNLHDTCYEVANIYQSIRVKCIKQKNTFTSSSQSYTDLEGIKLSSRLIKTKYFDLIMDMNNDFIYDRMQYLLCHDIIYIDGIRITDKQTFENDDRYNNTTNISQNKFKVAVDIEDTYKQTYQLYEPFTLTNKVPEGIISLNKYNTDTLTGTQYKLSFNKLIESLASNIYCDLYKNGVLFASFDNTKFSISGQDVLIDVSGNQITILDTYYIVIPPNMINSGVETFEGFNPGEWVFEIKNGDYNNLDYNNLDYNT